MSGKRTLSFQKAAAFEKTIFSHRQIKSQLASLLIDLWSWGHVSASLVQKIAQAAVQDGQRFTADFKINEWEILASLGNSGLSAQNVSRDLILQHYVHFQTILWQSRLQFRRACADWHELTFLSCTLLPCGDRLFNPVMSGVNASARMKT